MFNDKLSSYTAEMIIIVWWNTDIVRWKIIMNDETLSSFDETPSSFDEQMTIVWWSKIEGWWNTIVCNIIWSFLGLINRRLGNNLKELLKFTTEVIRRRSRSCFLLLFCTIRMIWYELGVIIRSDIRSIWKITVKSSS